ncbi:hypothetical protein VNI00_015704 [Paramarasmius palmivorus]|uniref:Uncharacterized protein n=1 Tax=Paramarasmius palmivorus TaxID=297713 RepID=A0AAW0BJ05_9AGAR
MPPVQTNTDKRFIKALSSEAIQEFRDYKFTASYIKKNAHLFLTNDWIDVQEFNNFLLDVAIQEPDSDGLTMVASSPPPEPLVKAEPVPEIIRPTASELVVKPEPHDPVIKDELDGNVRLCTIVEDRHKVHMIMDSDDESETEADGSKKGMKYEDGRESKEEPVVGWVKSDTDWDDPTIRAEMYVGVSKFKITREWTAQRLERINKPASFYPAFKVPTAVIIDVSDPKYNIIDPKTGLQYTVDHIIKDHDNESFKGPTGTGQPSVNARFGPDSDWISCRRSRVSCKGLFHCEFIDPDLLAVKRWGLETESRDRVLAVRKKAKSEEGTTPESIAAAFLNVIRRRSCPARDKSGNNCTGVPVLKSSGSRKFMGCSEWRPDWKKGHQTQSLWNQVDPKVLKKVLDGESSDSKDQNCGVLVSPRVGNKLSKCPHPHIVNGAAKAGAIVHCKCNVERTMLIPTDETKRMAILYHHKHVPHSHPMVPKDKLTKTAKATYKECIRATGSIGATRQEVDFAPTTSKIMEGQLPSEFDSGLHDHRKKRDLIHAEKLASYPHGFHITGLFNLFSIERLKSKEEQYIHRFISTPGGGTIIVTTVPYLLNFLHDVKCFEGDGAFKRLHEMTEWEMSLFHRGLQQAVTVLRIYLDRADTGHYKIMYDVLQELVFSLTGKPLRFKRLTPGGTLSGVNADMEIAHAMGMAQSFLPTNIPEHSGIDTQNAADILPYIFRLCHVHARRAILPFRSIGISSDDYHTLLNFVHLESRQAVDGFTSHVKKMNQKAISAWWDHKLSFPWILPCLIKALSPMYAEDWDAILPNTNTGESQHHWTNNLTGINLTLVVAVESARKVDNDVARLIKVTETSGVVQNSSNNLVDRVSRNIRRQDLAREKAHKSQKAASEASDLQDKISTEKESRKESLAREKALKEQLQELKASHSSSSGGVNKLFSNKPQGPKAKSAESSSSGRAKNPDNQLNCASDDPNTLPQLLLVPVSPATEPRPVLGDRDTLSVNSGTDTSMPHMPLPDLNPDQSFEYDPAFLQGLNEFLADEALKALSEPLGSSGLPAPNSPFGWQLGGPVVLEDSANAYYPSSDAMDELPLLPPLTLSLSPLPSSPLIESVAQVDTDIPEQWDERVMGRREDMDLSNIIPGCGIVTRKRAAENVVSLSKRARCD